MSEKDRSYMGEFGIDNDIVECFIEQDYEIARKAKLVRTNMELQDLHIKLTD